MTAIKLKNEAVLTSYVTPCVKGVELKHSTVLCASNTPETYERGGDLEIIIEN